jgi:hypothetical protein
MLIAIAIAAIFLSFFAFALALWAAIEVRASQKSTHQVQFMPIEDAVKKTPAKDFMKEDFDNII